MDRADTILALQRIGKIEIYSPDLNKYEILYKLISPSVYEGHRDRLNKGNYTLEFISTGINIKIEKNLGILLLNSLKTAEGIDYIYHEWRDIKDCYLADIIDIVMDKLLEKERTSQEQYEYEIRIYHCQKEDCSGYIAEVPELDGCYAIGETQEEALKKVQEKIKHYAASTVTKNNYMNEMPYHNSNPKDVLNKLKYDVNMSLFNAYSFSLSTSEIKAKINELEMNQLNYRA